jgi:hypothetical protein
MLLYFLFYSINKTVKQDIKEIINHYLAIKNFLDKKNNGEEPNYGKTWGTQKN